MGGFQKNAGGRGPLKHEEALAFLQRAESATGASVYEHLTSVVQEVRLPPPPSPAIPPGEPPPAARGRSRAPGLPAGAPGMHGGGSRERGARALGRGGCARGGGRPRPLTPPTRSSPPPPPPPPLARPPRPGRPPRAWGAIGNPPAARMGGFACVPPPARGRPPGARAGRAGGRAGGVEARRRPPLGRPVAAH